MRWRCSPAAIPLVLGPVVVGLLVTGSSCGPGKPDYQAPGGCPPTFPTCDRSSLAGVDGGGHVFQGVDGGGSDGGVDSGLPTEACDAGDTDGQGGTTPPLVISELHLGSPAYVEFFNRSQASVFPPSFGFQSAPALGQQVPVEELGPGQYELVPLSSPAGNGEIALFTQAGTMEFYMCWGTITSELQNTAISDGLWFQQGCEVPVPPSNESLHLMGVGTSNGDWQTGPPKPLGCALAR